MKVSLNTIKQFIDFDLPPVNDLVKRINEQLGKVESVQDVAGKYKGAVIAKIVSAEKHPNADKLSVCKIDDGGAVAGVPRDENGYVQVVCGAPNVRADMFAVWLPPTVTVPASFEDAEPFVLSARELRGILSQGMLAASDELAIGSDHNGIIEITTNDLPPALENKALTPGQDFSELFGLDDTVLDIENKMFTHRPDCFGQLGVAREIAGITGHAFKSPGWYLNTPVFNEATGLDLSTYSDAQPTVPRAMFVALKNVTIKPSPLWLQCALVAMGSKPINNVVDITNYIMLITAQPTHAYDYDKIAGATIGARMAQAGEKVTLLNGKAYELTPDDIVIADAEKPLGLAGIMGGKDSEVSSSTTNIILEVATFNMYTVRKSAMRHGVFTDALTRFNKGQSPLQNPSIMELGLQLLQDYVSCEQASAVMDIHGELQASPVVPVGTRFINERLGMAFDSEKIATLLKNVEIDVAHESGEQESYMNFGSPFWRTDLELPEDIVEEVGRLYGFDKLPRELPKRSVAATAKNETREVAGKIRTILQKAGANEVLTYSFVHKNVLEKANQDAAQAFQLGNALSPDLQFYRLSVLPSLLDKVHANIKAGYSEFLLFEIGKGHDKKFHATDDNGLPSEMQLVDAVYASKEQHAGAPFYVVRQYVEQLATDLGFEAVFEPADIAMDYPLTAPFDLTRSATVKSSNGEFIGMVGELKQNVLKNFKLPDYCAAFTLDLQGIVAATRHATAQYTPLSRYPSVMQDISLKVPADIEYSVLYHICAGAVKQAGNLDTTLSPISIYAAPDDMEHKTITLRAVATSYDKTLRDSDVTPIMDSIAAAAQTALHAERV